MSTTVIFSSILASASPDARSGLKGHVLHGFLSLIQKLRLKLQSYGRVALSLVTRKDTGGRFPLWRRHRGSLGGFFAFLDLSLLAAPGFLLRNGILQRGILYTGTRWKQEIGLLT